MQKTLCVLAGLAAGDFRPGPASAQDAVNIGMINEYSGQFADTGAQIDHGVTLYMKQHGDTVAGKKIVLIRKDTGGIAPDLAKRLAQEAIVRDHADILGGFSLTPNALAAADVSAEAKKFMVVMNAATSIITTKSPYIARTSSTTPQLNYTLGTWAAKNGIKTVYTMVSDYGPGIDAENWFQTGFKDGGGQIVGSVRFPVANPDFSAFIQAAKDADPDAIYIWIPGGAQPGAVGKALAERGVDTRKIKVLGQDALGSETALKSMGDAALGIITVADYDYNHQSPMNQEFVKAYNDEFHRNPGFLRRRRLRRHASDLRGAAEDRRPGRRRLPDRGRQGHELGKPARPDHDRSGDARHRPDRLYPPGRESRQRIAQRRVRQLARTSRIRAMRE